jgi:hypothetical protein
MVGVRRAKRPVTSCRISECHFMLMSVSDCFLSRAGELVTVDA